MKNLRIKNIIVNDSTNIDVYFTEKITKNISIDNILIISNQDNILNPSVLKLNIKDNVVGIVCQPLTALAAYTVKIISTASHSFLSLNGDALIINDGVSNTYLITGPIPSDNAIKNYFNSYYKDNIYNVEDNATLVGKYIDSLTTLFSKALSDIGQTKNENYISFSVIDEKKIRGSGPFDRLTEESAYEISRVGRAPSSSNSSMYFSFDSFSPNPVSLLKSSKTETLYSGSDSKPGYFNINSFIITTNNYPVIKVNKIIFYLETEVAQYTYNIETLGYQIKNSKYDKEYAFNFTLEDNQIKLNSKILDDENFNLNKIISIYIEYDYKDLARIINEDTLQVTSIIDITRESVPPIINIFNLNNSPLVDANGDLYSSGGISFLNPNDISNNHPAFVYEIPFRLNALPSSIGQYSVDYSTGTIYVYGEDDTNSGTGPYPPLVSYSYLLTYKSEQDYVYDYDTLDIIALPYGNLLEASANIEFSYEEVLVPGVDYDCSLHKESLNERINNKLLASNVLKTNYSPITSVFQVYNETSGEIYTIDRWSDNKVYFRYNNPPKIEEIVQERASFEYVLNEVLYVDTIINSNIFKVNLSNNFIISNTEDSIASSFNTSLILSGDDIFVKEKYFNREVDLDTNVSRLTSAGDYFVDYENGVIYCNVVEVSNFSIGTASYKKNNVVPQRTHLISVDDVYYQVDISENKDKKFDYISFDEASIVVDNLDYSDEISLNESVYQINNYEIGVFDSLSFTSGVADNVSFIRSVFEYEDLLNNDNPINFASVTTFSGKILQTNSISKNIYDNIKYDGVNYYILLDENVSYISDNISFDFSIVRVSDSQELWDTSGVIVTGSQLKLVLSGANSPNENDYVYITYSFSIKDLSRVIIDYNKGELYIDYAALTDELVVNYEYGDNVIDFRKNTNLPKNSEYYVTYKVGALRNALVKNFGSLIDIPELSNFDMDFNRERYRDAIYAALSSFTQGPTISAIKNIAKTISHVDPEITESIFQNWSLGNSLLNPQKITTSGDFSFLPAKFGNGVLIDSNQTISFPFASNIRLEEGTFETWISPLWDGVDNDATLSFNILKDGYAIDASEVFIGTSEQHPTISSGSFSLSKLLNNSGIPNKNKNGIFIYYDLDNTAGYNKWFVEIIDGYAGAPSSSYKIKITSSGLFYDAKNLSDTSNLNMFTGTNSLTLNISAGSVIDEIVSFVSDTEHYLFDFGNEKLKNRFSLFKDVSGYFNFKVLDNKKTVYLLSSNVSSWKKGELHHVAISWKLNTYNNVDEMHLFIDGFEVPNMMRAGQKLKPYLNENFRTINPEQIVGSVTRDIVGSNDLQVIYGSPNVTSSINFSAYNVFPGDLIFINESGFSESGYSILAVDGQILTLTENMPLTLASCKYSVNKTEFTVTSEIDVYKNIAVYTIHPALVGNDLSGAIGSNILYTSYNLDDIIPGNIIRVDGSIDTTYTILEVNDNNFIIDANLEEDIVGVNYRIYSSDENELYGVKTLSPDYSISKDDSYNNILTISNNVLAGDLILIKTFGLNFRRIKKQNYIWGDGYENILMTKLAPPISLDEVKINKFILTPISIDKNNSTISTNLFTSNNILTDQPSVSQTGRTVSAILSGTNIDFSSPTYVAIDGVDGNGSSVSETLSFNDYGSLDFANKYTGINYVNVVALSTNSNKAIGTIALKEKYPLTNGESDGYYPVIRFSYPIITGTGLYQSSSNVVTDDEVVFSKMYIGNYLAITSPSSVSGYYKITDVSDDRKSISLNSDISSFSGGVYQVLITSSDRGGFQNGFFTFEKDTDIVEPYYLNKGTYEFEYYSNVNIDFDPIFGDAYIGSNLFSVNQFNGVIDQIKLYSTMLLDTRVGESIPSNQRSITKDFNSLKPLKDDVNTLCLIDFDVYPFVNSSKFYSIISENKKQFYSSIVVNDNFNNSIAILEKPIIISNDGILDTKKEGTIEFWANPFYDTHNDPATRYYFDAYGAVTEEVVSINNVSLKLSNAASKIISVQLKSSNNTDYFAGGLIEIDTQNAIQEEGTSISNNSVIVSRPIFQVLSVKINNDPTEVDYFNNGTIGSDMKTIYFGKLLPHDNLSLVITYKTTENKTLNSQIIRLNKKLPYQKSNVVVRYIPDGLQGDRISIFKDISGYLNFKITASESDFIIKAPIVWSKNSWHRVKASYIINNESNLNEMKLFVDGYCYDDAQFSNANLVDGYSISFKDPINEIFIGSSYDENNNLFSLIDNFRISNISRPLFAPYGQSLDVSYSSNISSVFPVTKDLYATYLLNFDVINKLCDDFITLKNKNTGLFDFSVNVIDSFDIVKNNIKSKEALEKLIKILKPANSRVYIKYS